MWNWVSSKHWHRTLSSELYTSNSELKILSSFFLVQQCTIYITYMYLRHMSHSMVLCLIKSKYLKLKLYTIRMRAICVLWTYPSPADRECNLFFCFSFFLFCRFIKLQVNKGLSRTKEQVLLPITIHWWPKWS